MADKPRRLGARNDITNSTPPENDTLRGRSASAASLVFAAVLAFVAANFLLFGSSLYRPFLDPSSSVGSFELTVARLRQAGLDRRRDVLVLGDSRVLAGLDLPKADAAGGSLRFVSAAVPGTTPRCWAFLVRAIDPASDRFRAVVIPVDTYADDDSASGSEDGNNRMFDLRFIVFRVGFAEAFRVARTFSNVVTRLHVAIDLLLRGPELRDDVVRAEWRAPQPIAQEPHLRVWTLAGLKVDFTHDRITFPASVPPNERIAIARQVLAPVAPSPSYGAYRREWLGWLIARYRESGTPVIFVRIPARPAHRTAPSGASGSLLEFARQGGARLIPQGPYLALERPELFADHDHLNGAGAERFSRHLGLDVARALDPDPDPVAPSDPVNRAPQPVAAAAPSAAAVPLPVAPATKTRAPAAISIPTVAVLPWPQHGVLFQSYDFFLFFIAVLIAFYASPLRWRRTILLVASYAFYASWNQWYVLMLIALTATDFGVALAIERAPPASRRGLLALGIAANVAFLGFLKYANFATGTLAALLGLSGDPWLLSLIVPVGISFHTFQSISYLVDVYRKTIRAVRNPLDYALYIAFFPQLLAGPIVRAGRFFGELYGWQTPSREKVTLGVGEIIAGLLKKTVLADQFATVSDVYFGALGTPTHLGAPAAWSGALAFALQIYFDFSGYSDIAIGSARLLGFDFPENFHRPYLAWGFTEFWRRWHMTLSSWLRDYLYIPLGGNRGGLAATVRNIMLTMLIGGLWHGANWTFVAWGGYHGIFLSIERVCRNRFGSFRPTGLIRVAATLLTFLLVLFGWVLFRAGSFSDAWLVLGRMFAGGAGDGLLAPWTLVLAAIAFGIEVAQERGARIDWNALPRLGQIGALAGVLLALELLAVPSDATPFIYFKF